MVYMKRTTEYPPLTPAVFHILLALATTDRHGYDIMKRVELDSEGSVKMGPGTLYGSIKRMLSDGFIEESGERPDPSLDDTRRKYYRITPFGKKLLSVEIERMSHVMNIAQRLKLNSSQT
jgi:DNA-binding PadR family transcriptional regulator